MTDEKEPEGERLRKVIKGQNVTLCTLLAERDAARAQVEKLREALLAANEALSDGDDFRAHQYVRAALDSPAPSDEKGR